MNKTTEALKLAEEALGNLIGWMDANKFVVLPKERKNLAAIREARAEQDKQELVAWDLAEKVRRDLDRQSCPDAYMRIAIESIVKHFPAPQHVQAITEAVDAAMVEMKNIYPPLRRSEYERLIRAAEYVAPVSVEAIRAEALEEAANVCEQCTGDAIQTETLKLLLQERGRIASVIRGLK